MKSGYRQFLACISALLVCCAAQAQSFPSKPVHLVVPYAPGGSADAVARVLAEQLSRRWDQPVVVDLKPGGGTVIGVAHAAKAPPDGYTMVFISGSYVINAKLQKDLPYNGIKALDPIANMVNSPLVISTQPDSRFKSLADVIQEARARPGTVSIGSVGPATTMHIAIELLQRATGAKFIYTTFGGGAPAVTSALGGHIDLVITNLSEVSSQIAAGKLRALAVTTEERVESLKQVPTVAEAAGIAGYEIAAWFGFAAPAGTPLEARSKVAEGIRAALEQPEVRQRISALGLEPAYMGPRKFGDYINAEYARYSKVIDEAGIKK